MQSKQLLERLKATLAGAASEADVVSIAEKLIEEGVEVGQAIDLASEAIREVGDAFERGDLYLPELMIAGRKMERCMAVLRPHLKAGSKRAGGRVVLGTVSGDIHDIGKNLVGTTLAVGGFDVTDLGVNVPPLSFVTAARDKQADILALSALMTAAMPYQREVIKLLEEMHLRDRFFVIVGGGPVTVAFATEIGADGWAENAAGALRLCDRIMASGARPPATELFTV